MTQWDPLTEAIVAATEDKKQTNVDEEQQSMSQSPFPAVPATTSQHQHQLQQQERTSKPQTSTQENIVTQHQPIDFRLLRAKFEKWVRQQLIVFYAK